MPFQNHFISVPNYTFYTIIGTYRPVTQGDNGVQGLIENMLNLGGLLKHHPFLVRKKCPSDHALSNIKDIIIDSNHQFFLYTHLYLFHCHFSILFWFHHSSTFNELPEWLVKEIKSLGGFHLCIECKDEALNPETGSIWFLPLSLFYCYLTVW